MSERMLNTKICCLVYELMLNAKMCNVRTYVTHENMMPGVRTLCYIQKCVMFEHMFHTNMRFVLSELV